MSGQIWHPSHICLDHLYIFLPQYRSLRQQKYYAVTRKWFHNAANSRRTCRMRRLLHTSFRPALYIPSTVAVCWLSHHTAVRLDLRLLLSSSAFTLGVLQRERGEVLEVKLPLFHTSLSRLPLSL